jgi:hypothetical protein
MRDDGLTDNLAQAYRHCVSDQAAQYAEPHGFAWAYELVPRRERLQDSGFT